MPRGNRKGVFLRWARPAAGLLLWAGGTLGGASALAQVPEPAGVTAPAAERAGAARYHLNKHTIQLPIVLDERARPMLQEIQLYYKEQPSAPWALRDKAGPTQTAFTFQAPRDGEYWFTMVTVDRQGRRVPPDVSREEPALVVVVDTQPPQPDVVSLGQSPEGHLIQCDVHDDHPDASKTRFQFQTVDKVFRDLDALPGRPNVYCIPAQANTTGKCRVCATDRAGNTVTREYVVAQLPAPGKVAAAPPAAAPPAAAPPAAAPPAAAPKATAAAPKAEGPKAEAPMAQPTVEQAAPAAKVTMPAAEKVAAPALLPGNLGGNPGLGAPPAGPVLQGPPETKASAPAATAPVQPASASVPQVSPELPAGAPGLTPTGTTVPQAAPTPAAAPVATPPTIAPKREGVPAHHQLVNSTRLFLEYRIEQAGASGVGRVEVWYTRDKGQSWSRLCEDHARKSPAEVLLPGDGVYGLTLVVSNGLGFGGQPPVPGDAPDWWIEVDTAKPAAQITSVKLVTDDGPAVHVGWAAQDHNLGSTPAELAYAISRQGPWVPIAKNLKGEGVFRWVPPMDIGTQAFLRLTVRDLAGNVTITETTQPIALDDLSRPRARIAGISTDGSRSPAATPASAPQPNGN
jgi:hypothetical protein